ncbi:MAG: STAS domain-containing protein [bacterium]|nr:STAS domain-containing protein [bacterium]
MDIIIKNVGLNGLMVYASGRLDLDNAVEYGTKIKDTIEDSEEVITEVILDFAEITFISSFGLKVVLELYKQLKTQNGVLKLKNVSEQLMGSFKIVGFDKFLVFE